MVRTASTSDPPPAWLVAQRWERLLFAHWPVDAADLRPLLPPGVEPDVRNGNAWIAIVAFVMVGTRASGPPWWPVLPPIPELNVRTYVRVDGVPAVWFLSLDASSSFFATVGRALYGMRYHVADMHASECGGVVRFRSARQGAAFAATYAPDGPVRKAEPGSLEHFLVERYRLFSERRGRLITAVVAHEPWPLQRARARVDVNEMAPKSVALRGEPIVHFCRSVSAVISAPSPTGSVLGDVTRPRRARRPGRAGLRDRIEPARRAHMPSDAS
jgi:uncharacterized protein YqjF (DUF2071 family)